MYNRCQSGYGRARSGCFLLVFVLFLVTGLVFPPSAMGNMVVNEVSPLGDGSSGHDWVELRVLEPVTLDGPYLDYDGGTVPLRVVDATLSAGDTVVVHGTTGTSDTNTIDGGSGDDAGDTYWDIYDDSFGLTGTNDFVFLRTGGDTILDALIWEDISNGSIDQQSALNDAIAAGEWTSQGKNLVEQDALSSEGGTRRVYYRDRNLSDSSSRFGWDFIPTNMTLGATNSDSAFNAYTGSGTAPRRPQGVVASGFSGFSFDVTYTGEYEFGTDGREGYLVERIPVGFPDPDLSDPSAPGYTTITASDDSLNDSGTFVTSSGDTVVWAELIAGVTGFDPGDTVEIRFGNPDEGGPGLSVSGTGTDTFWIRSDPTGNNYERLPKASQPTLVRSTPDSVVVDPSSLTVSAGDIASFSGVVKDASGNSLLGGELDYTVVEKPDGADSAVMIDTTPSDGVSNKEGTVKYKYQTDTGSSGKYTIRVALSADTTVADSITINVDFDPVALGTSRLVADTVVNVALADLGTDDRSWLLYNPTRQPVDLSGYWLARYTSSRNWNSPTSDVQIGSLTLNNASNYVIEAGGWYLIARDASVVPEADAVWGDLVIGTGYGFALFPQDPNNYSDAQTAVENRLDAIGFADSQNVYENDTVPNNPTSSNLPHRRPDTEPGAFLDREINSQDIDQPTGKDTRKNTAADTVRPAFDLSGASSIQSGETITLSGTFSVRQFNGLQSDSVVNDYEGDSAWAEVFLDEGSVTPDTSGVFTGGRVNQSFSVSNTSGTVILSFVDGVAEGSHKFVINDPPQVDLTEPKTGDLVGGENVPGTYVLTDVNDDPGTVTVEVSDDSGVTWTEATVNGEITSVSSSSAGDTHTFRWDSVNDLGTVNDTQVKLRIRAYDGFDTSTYDTSGAFTVDNRAPPRIDDLGSTAAVNPPDTGASLYWSYSSRDIQEFGLYRVERTSDTTSANRIDTHPVESDTHIYLDSTVVRGDSHFYYITAVDTAGNESDSSNATTPPHVALSKAQDDTASHRPGDTIEYTINYTNDGFGPTGKIELQDAIPDSTVLSDTAEVVSGPSATIEYSPDNGSTWQTSSYPRADIDQVRWTINEDVDPRASGDVGSLRFRVILE